MDVDSRTPGKQLGHSRGKIPVFDRINVFQMWACTGDIEPVPEEIEALPL